MQTIGLLWEADERIASHKRPVGRLIPACAQIHQAGGIVELAGEAEGGRCGTALRRAPRIVVEHVRRGAAAVEGLAHAAKGVVAVPGLDGAVEREQVIVTVDVVGGRAANGALEHVAQGSDEILGEAGGRGARRLRHQRPIAGIGVRGAALGGEPVERVITETDQLFHKRPTKGRVNQSEVACEQRASRGSSRGLRGIVRCNSFPLLSNTRMWHKLIFAPVATTAKTPSVT